MNRNLINLIITSLSVRLTGVQPTLFSLIVALEVRLIRVSSLDLISPINPIACEVDSLDEVKLLESMSSKSLELRSSMLTLLSISSEESSNLPASIASKSHKEKERESI